VNNTRKTNAGKILYESGERMSYKSYIILFSSVLLMAFIIAPGVLADNSCLDCHEKLSAFSEKEKELNEIRIKHLARMWLALLNAMQRQLIK